MEHSLSCLGDSPLGVMVSAQHERREERTAPKVARFSAKYQNKNLWRNP